jgi:hypothetical protein
MEREPTEAYVFQPDPPPRFDTDPRIYAVAGPGTESYRNKRFTRDTAEKIAAFLNGMQNVRVFIGFPKET